MSSSKDRRFARALIGTSMLDEYTPRRPITLPREPFASARAAFWLALATAVGAALIALWG